MASDVVKTRESKAQQTLQSFWPNVTEEIQNISPDYFREPQELPLARIKKIMKMDDNVRLVSAEVPMMFAKAAEIFITELTLRSWIHTEDSRRRTMQRSDIAMAITKFDQFDFLIDFVPSYELKPPKQQGQPRQSAELTQYLFSLGQQPGAVPGHGQQHGAMPPLHGQHQGQQVNMPAATTVQPGQVIIGQHLSQGTHTSAPVGEGQQYQHIPMPHNALGQLQYLRGQIQKPANTMQQITQTDQQGQHFWQNYK